MRLISGMRVSVCGVCGCACVMYVDLVQHQLGAQLHDVPFVHLSTDLVLFEGLEAFFKVRTASRRDKGIVWLGPVQSQCWHARHHSLSCY